MKGYVIKLTRRDIPKAGFIFAGTTTWSPKIKFAVTSPLITMAVTSWRAPSSQFFVFESKQEALELKKLLVRFQQVNQLYALPSVPSFPIRYSVVPYEASEIIYADFDQIMDSLDGFEDQLEKSGHFLAKFWKTRRCR